MTKSTDFTHSRDREQFVVTYDDASIALLVSLRTVQRLVALGELRVVRCGRAVRVTRASIDEFISRGGTAR